MTPIEREKRLGELDAAVRAMAEHPGPLLDALRAAADLLQDQPQAQSAGIPTPEAPALVAPVPTTEQAGQLAVDLQEMERALILLRLNKNFGWTGILVEFLHHLLELLPPPLRRPQRPPRPAVSNPGPLPERPRHPDSKGILAGVQSHGDEVFRPVKKP